MSVPFLQIQGITKRYAQHTALDQVSFDVKQGAVLGLLGPNGAGKTSLIRILTQITAPDEGRILMNGRAIKPEDVERMGYLPEERGLYKKMEVGEQLIYMGRLKGLSKADVMARLKVWVDKFEIRDWWKKKIEELFERHAAKGAVYCHGVASARFSYSG
jgi:ABC-2 type transport system ATP-binding protein